ncbi:MAG: hypothetical protein JWQ03_561, partial [Variovorax sp.]|nr:hypothetical protein [Variovorax sp.]
MKLVPQDPALGHWVDPDWQKDRPGTHALVIGISAYAHFDGGAAPAAGTDDWISDCRGLGQLQVSALTAWRVFEWLNRDYQLADAPLVSCHLLLSPQPGELKVASPMDSCSAQPTLANCQQAVRAWAGGMRALAPEVARLSRGLMFFSGHGAEVDAERQILLPCDYLAGAMPSPNDAIGTENIRQGLALLPMSQVLLFIDACRNDSAALRQLDVDGSPILTSGKAALTNSLQTSAVLYATASNRSAYQHTSADQGLSMYGTALLEGLRGLAGMQVRELAKGRDIPLFNLQPFVESRVTALLQGIPGAAAAAGWQAVSLAGRRLSNLTVTELPPSGLILMGRPHAAVARMPWEQEPREPAGPVARDPNAVVTQLVEGPDLPLPPSSPSAASFSPQETLRRTALGEAIGNEAIAALWTHHTRLAPVS